MIVNNQIDLIVVLMVPVLIGACLIYQFGKRIERAVEGVQRENFGVWPLNSPWGSVSVDAQTIEYRAYPLPDGIINIGTYYPVKGVK